MFIASFEYPLDLHYSQTSKPALTYLFEFEYPLDLHYSQTLAAPNFIDFSFEYPLDLHYSQTDKQTSTHTLCLNTLWIYTTLKPQHHQQIHLCV